MLGAVGAGSNAGPHFCLGHARASRLRSHYQPPLRRAPNRPTISNAQNLPGDIALLSLLFHVSMSLSEVAASDRARPACLMVMSS